MIYLGRYWTYAVYLEMHNFSMILKVHINLLLIHCFYFVLCIACPDGQVWSNYSLCQRTCETRDKNIDAECSQNVPGCVCPEGLYMEAEKCVNITECQKCVVNGTVYQVNSSNYNNTKYCKRITSSDVFFLVTLAVDIL